MPLKRRAEKAKRKVVSARAKEIFRSNPGAIQPPVIVDGELAEELGRDALIAYPDTADLIEHLSVARD